MGDVIHDDNGVSGGLTRRAALRAGVAVGVGVAAWSGASITSFGGTPAYAAVCSQAIPPVDISGSCRNTTNSCDPFAYQAAVFNPPAGYSLTSVGNNVCCTANTPGTFGFPANTTCTLTFTFFDGCPSGTVLGSFSFGPQFSGNAPGSMPIQYKCPNPYNDVSNAQYNVTAFCFSGDTFDPNCFP